MHRVRAVEGLHSFNWPQVSVVIFHNTFHYQEYLPGTSALNNPPRGITPVSMPSSRSSLQIPSYHPYHHYILKHDGVITLQSIDSVRMLHRISIAVAYTPFVKNI